MGNCTATIKKRTGVTAVGQAMIADVALSSSYATGGDTVPLTIFPLAGISMLLANSITTPGGHAVEVIHGASDGVAPKLRVRDVATGAELTNATDNSAQSVRLIAISDPFV